MSGYRKPFVLALMPFSNDFSDIYKFGIEQACKDAGVDCDRVDKQIFDEDILRRIYGQIAKADIVVADMTGRNPNVLYEAGYAHALNKRVILLTQKVDDIPFDLKHYRHIVYEGSIAKLKTDLEVEIRWTIENPKVSLSQLTAEVIVNEYLLGSLPLSQRTPALRLKLKLIKQELDSIGLGIVPFSYKELAEAEERGIQESMANGNQTQYWDIYIINSDRCLGFWGSEYSAYPYFLKYVSLQKQVLNSGGNVVRLFLFDPTYLKTRLSKCQDVVRRHNLLFEGTINRVKTLCALLRPEGELPRDDFTILDKKEVFIWRRGFGEEAKLFISGQYINDTAQVQNYINKWNRLSENALQSDDLSKLVKIKGSGSSLNKLQIKSSNRKVKGTISIQEAKNDSKGTRKKAR